MLVNGMRFATVDLTREVVRHTDQSAGFVLSTGPKTMCRECCRQTSPDGKPDPGKHEHNPEEVTDKEEARHYGIHPNESSRATEGFASSPTEEIVCWVPMSVCLRY